MDDSWRVARARAMFQAGAKARAMSTLVFFLAGLAIILSYDFAANAFTWYAPFGVLGAITLVASYVVFARRRGKPLSFRCPGCKQAIPLTSERCPICGYAPQTPRT